MTNPAVAVHGLTKIFSVPFHRQSIVAVKDLNLRIEPGEVYGLLGPNGSGKSTTLKIILGLVSPTRGRTEIFGVTVVLSKAGKRSVFCRKIRISTNILAERKRCYFLAVFADCEAPS